MAEHPIFADIDSSDLEAVKAHVLADAAVLEERDGEQMTPLMYAIDQDEHAIAHWLIQHRGQHDVNTRRRQKTTALNMACSRGNRSIVEALVAAGADAEYRLRSNLLMASFNGHANIVGFLIQSAPSTIEASLNPRSGCKTPLLYASFRGHAAIVRLLLDAGANPTLSASGLSPISIAIKCNHQSTARVLRKAIAERDRAYTLAKVRALLTAVPAILKAHTDASDACEGESLMLQTRATLAATPPYLKARVAWGKQELPHVVITPHASISQTVRETVEWALGLCDESEGPELFEELLAYMVPAWADKGPDVDRDGSDSDSELESEVEGGNGGEASEDGGEDGSDFEDDDESYDADDEAE